MRACSNDYVVSLKQSILLYSTMVLSLDLTPYPTLLYYRHLKGAMKTNECGKIQAACVKVFAHYKYVHYK